ISEENKGVETAASSVLFINSRWCMCLIVPKDEESINEIETLRDPNRQNINGVQSTNRGHSMKTVILKTAAALLAADVAEGGDFDSRVTHGSADSNGVKIHYASIGKGPLMVMIHGFPDFWYTWRAQMEALS